MPGTTYPAKWKHMMKFHRHHGLIKVMCMNMKKYTYTSISPNNHIFVWIDKPKTSGFFQVSHDKAPIRGYPLRRGRMDIPNHRKTTTLSNQKGKSWGWNQPHHPGNASFCWNWSAVFFGVETFESTNFHGTRDSHHASIFVRGSHRGGVWQVYRRISRGKKKHASDWNGTSFASDSLVATKRWPKRCRIWGGWCVERDPKYWAFLQRKI